MKDGKEKLNLPITKPKTLHELLKQGSGHNLVLDFSMLSKRGGLIEKAKKYQNINNQKIQSEIINNDKTKISKNFERGILADCSLYTLSVLLINSFLLVLRYS